MIMKSAIAAALLYVAFSTQASATIVIQKFASSTSPTYSLMVYYDTTMQDSSGNFKITDVKGDVDGMTIGPPVIPADAYIHIDDPSNPSLFGGKITFSNGVDNFDLDLNRIDDLTNHTGAGLSVPEPGGWAMMLAGFAGIGGAMRTARRRRWANPKRAIA